MEYRNKLALGGVCLALMLSGCSDNDSSRSQVNAYVQVGQQDFDNALVWSVTVEESGLPSVDSEGRLNRSASVTDENGEVRVRLATNEVHMFQVSGQIERTESDIDATVRRCQWVAGCGDIAFAQDFAVTTDVVWRSVVRDLSRNERIRVTPLTDLAAELAFERRYMEDAQNDDGSLGQWVQTGYFTDYSVEQSISQLSKLFGIMNIQTTQPADLSRPQNWDGSNSVVSQDQLRYGALVAAFQGLELDRPAKLEAFAQQLVANDGQLNTVDGEFALSGIFQAAIDNLAQLPNLSVRAEEYRDAVVAQLQADIAALQQGDELTAIAPAPVVELIAADDAEDITVGLARTKAFVSHLKSIDDNFFEEGYREPLDAHMDQLKALGDEHADNLDVIVQSFIQTQELYVDCHANVSLCSATGRNWPWLQQVDSFSNNVLTLNGGQIVVGQQPADLNVTDEDDDPQQSQAIDVLITGQYQQGDLRFVVDHQYEKDDKDEPIESASGVRLYYPTASAGVQPESEVIGYEIRWSDFQLYDVADQGGANETEINGGYRLFLRGVKDPQNPDSERRFNIDSVVLNGRISDVVSDDDDDDNEVTTVIVSATADNAIDFYPTKKFASFNGFFTPQTGGVYDKGSVETDLVRYQLGNETLGGQDVEFMDFFIRGGDNVRYRFYPTVERTDDNDRDNDRDRDETFFTFDLESCDLIEQDGNWVVEQCDPKTRFIAERDRQDAINDLWEAGAFSRVEVPGRGTYFIDWPVEQTANQCLELAPLSNSGSFDGTLYEPMVLGLNSLRFTTQLFLEYGVKNEPRTLLDVSVAAKTLDEYSVSAALSHDYSGLSTSTPILGSGSNLDRIVVNYATDRTFDIRGSIGIYQDGVVLSLADGTQERVDSSLTLNGVQDRGLTPLPYRYDVDEEGNYDRCIIANQAEFETTTKLEDMEFTLNFRDTVYGKVRNENGVWVVRYIDGTFETLL
ncbi:hypothetical protein CHH28_15545 [Bacterioplanes sanyensis]|uniref:Uncharacterized protein n=1 Tax=Bacterioplanes sanyensis TaxID=1249553 RepID=A0A222FNP3_9GAMM|nr:hypothetical protein [Bacterioplanes sanyensis]ASP40001.1 hypothetical protein CHH28_15545 [Bacterioplanes sanyensis]